MKLFRDEDGQMLVMTALTMVVLLGFVALATDVGVFFHTRRQMQTAADAAATAGAMDVLNNDPGAVQADANRAAANNGFSKSNGSVVTVSTPPVDGYHQSAGYVEVTIQQPSPTIFMRMFGFASMNISTRAVAGSPGASTYCAYLMDPTGVDFQVQGSAVINSPGCGWYINSNGTAAGYTVHSTGGAATINAPYINSVGSGGVSSIGGAPVYSNVPPVSPPNLQSVGAAPPAGCTATYSGASYSTKIDGNNGVVCFTNTSGVDISGSTLNNGVFVFQYGVTVGNPNGNTNMNNATMEVYGGQFIQNSNSLFNITAPASLTETFGGLSYDGVALLVPAANTTYNNSLCKSVVHGNQTGNGALNIQIGSSGQKFEGFIVAPNAMVFLNDQGTPYPNAVTFSGLYSACLYEKSSTINIPSYNAANPTTTPLRVVSLVE